MIKLPVHCDSNRSSDVVNFHYSSVKTILLTKMAEHVTLHKHHRKSIFFKDNLMTPIAWLKSREIALKVTRTLSNKIWSFTRARFGRAGTDKRKARSSENRGTDKTVHTRCVLETGIDRARHMKLQRLVFMRLHRQWRSLDDDRAVRGFRSSFSNSSALPPPFCRKLYGVKRTRFTVNSLGKKFIPRTLKGFEKCMDNLKSRLLVF